MKNFLWIKKWFKVAKSGCYVIICAFCWLVSRIFPSEIFGDGQIGSSGGGVNHNTPDAVDPETGVSMKNGQFVQNYRGASHQRQDHNAAHIDHMRHQNTNSHHRH